MSFLAELKTLYCVALKRSRGGDAAERVEAFYQGQAENFDNFRGRLLHGRRELFAAIAAPPDGIWVDMGGGTGWNLEQLGRRIDALGRAYIVDLSPSMLKVGAGGSNSETGRTSRRSRPTPPPFARPRAKRMSLRFPIRLR